MGNCFVLVKKRGSSEKVFWSLTMCPTAHASRGFPTPFFLHNKGTLEHETGVSVMVPDGLIRVWKPRGFSKLLHPVVPFQSVHFWVLKIQEQRVCMPTLPRIGQQWGLKHSSCLFKIKPYSQHQFDGICALRGIQQGSPQTNSFMGNAQIPFPVHFSAAGLRVDSLPSPCCRKWHHAVAWNTSALCSNSSRPIPPWQDTVLKSPLDTRSSIQTDLDPMGLPLVPNKSFEISSTSACSHATWEC